MQTPNADSQYNKMSFNFQSHPAQSHPASHISSTQKQSQSSRSVPSSNTTKKKRSSARNRQHTSKPRAREQKRAYKLQKRPAKRFPDRRCWGPSSCTASLSLSRVTPLTSLSLVSPSRRPLRARASVDSVGARILDARREPYFAAFLQWSKVQ